MTELLKINLPEFKGNPQWVNISNSPVLPNALIEGIKAKMCLQNAYETALCMGDLLVEGILIVQSETVGISFHFHCWNKCRSTQCYYDVTNDYVWKKNEKFIEKRVREYGHNVTYRYISCVEYPSTDCNIIQGHLCFRFSYTNLIKSLKKQVESNNRTLDKNI